ncbi:MAG: type VI secretion system baseplate subunit TssE [Pyrinomonadaceae bacterium]
MARTSKDETGVTISILDRLLDYDPDASREADVSRPKSVRQLRDAVKRDLEWLLNTRQLAPDLLADLKEINNSVAAFGLPDFTNLNPQKIEDQKEIRRQIENTIRIFEPRLESVVVTFQPSQSTDRLMHFRINAHLKLSPEPEPIAFDTVVQMGSGQYVVHEE